MKKFMSNFQLNVTQFSMVRSKSDSPHFFSNSLLLHTTMALMQFQLLLHQDDPFDETHLDAARGLSN